MAGQIWDKIEARLEEWGFTWADVARGIGYSEGTVSGCRGGGYGASAARVEARAERWYARECARSGAPLGLPFALTPAARKAFAAFSHADSQNRKDRQADFVLVSGSSTIGKTAIARRFAELNPHVVHMEPFCEEKPWSLARELCKRVGVKAHGSAADMGAAYAAYARQYGTLLIVDDIDGLSKDALHFLRKILDISGHCIVLMSTHEFYRRLERMAREDPLVEQVFNRIRTEVQLDDPGPRRGNSDRVRAYQALLEPYSLSEENVKKLGQITDWNTRRLHTVVKDCQAANDGRVSARGLLEAAKGDAKREGAAS